LLVNPTVNVLDAFLISDDVMLVQYHNHDGFVQDTNHSNIAVAAFTTAYARLKLYELLDQLQERILYFDTDSVIFTAKDGEYIPPLGPYLGDLTNEIAEYGDQCYISHFVSGGPKNYCIVIQNPTTSEQHYKCRVKGICLNFEAEKHVNFSSIRELVRNRVENKEEETEIYVPQLLFRTNQHGEVSTANIQKKYRVVYDKRRLLPDYTTIPFGYVD
jgi:hypothetical protein